MTNDDFYNNGKIDAYEACLNILKKEDKRLAIRMIAWNLSVCKENIKDENKLHKPK